MAAVTYMELRENLAKIADLASRVYGLDGHVKYVAMNKRKEQYEKAARIWDEVAALCLKVESYAKLKALHYRNDVNGIKNN